MIPKKITLAVVLAATNSLTQASFTAFNDAVLSTSDLDTVAGEFESYYEWLWTNGFQQTYKLQFDMCQQFNDHSQASPFETTWNGGTKPTEDYMGLICPATKSAPTADEIFMIRSSKYDDRCLKVAFDSAELNIKECDSSAVTQWFYFKTDGSGNKFLVNYQSDAVLSPEPRYSDECEGGGMRASFWDATANAPYGLQDNYALAVSTGAAVTSTNPDARTLKFDQSNVEYASDKTPYLTIHMQQYGDYLHYETNVCMSGLGEEAEWILESASGSTGTCFNGNSKVTVLSDANGVSRKLSLSDIKPGDKVLAMDKSMQKVFRTVKAVPHSKSTTDFLEIALRDEGTLPTRKLAVTEHHTFPVCGGLKKHGKELPAHAIKAGQCLFTEHGKRIVESVTKVPHTEDDVTYTVQLEGVTDLLVLNGIVTHAKPSPPDMSKLSSSISATSATMNKHLLEQHSPHHHHEHRRLEEGEESCDEDCKKMDPTCAKYASKCQWDDDLGFIAISVCDTPNQLLIDRGVRDCDYGPMMVYNYFEYEEKPCSCQQSMMDNENVCSDTTSTSEEGEHCYALPGCEMNSESCTENTLNPPATWLYGGFLSGESFATQKATSDSDTYMLWDKATLPFPLVGPGGSFTLPSDVTSGVVVGAKMYDADFVMNGTAGVTEMVYIDVLTDSTSNILFSEGAVVVLGGKNAGKLSGTGSDPVKLTKLSNTGMVTFENNIGGILITDTVNEAAGVVDLINCKASVHGVTNGGTVNLNGGEYIYKGGTNEGTINVDGLGVQATYLADNTGTININMGTVTATIGSNSGTINMLSGTAQAMFTTNSGTINISDGVTGSLTVPGTGQTGSIYYKGATITASMDDGAVSITIT